MGPFEGHISPIHSVAYSSDGKIIRVWNAELQLDKLTRTNSDLSSTDDKKFGTSVARDDILCTTDYGHDCEDDVFGDSSKLVGGWVLNWASDLLFWVPPRKPGLWRPRSTIIIGEAANLTNFVHGDSRHECML